MAGSLRNFHKMDSRSACIQDVLKVKVKVKSHVIWALLCWHENRFFSQANGWIATKLAHDGLQVSLHPGCAQGQGHSQRSRDTRTFLDSWNELLRHWRSGFLSTFMCMCLFAFFCSKSGSGGNHFLLGTQSTDDKNVCSWIIQQIRYISCSLLRSCITVSELSELLSRTFYRLTLVLQPTASKHWRLLLLLLLLACIFGLLSVEYCL